MGDLVKDPLNPHVAASARVLVVDDSRAQRRVVTLGLRKLGHHVVEAESGADALIRIAEQPPDIIISDWMMPGMSGLDLCRAIRGREAEGYIYFILLTSKSEAADIAHGLDIGADDFLTKPVGLDELRARLVAGARIIAMERALTEKTRAIRTALEEIQTLYAEIDRDMIAGRALQRSLLPPPEARFGPARVTRLLQSSGHLGGDLVSYFPVGGATLGFYGLDVSGHGIASALMTARLAGFLSRAAPEQNVALEPDGTGGWRGLPPQQVARRLNDEVLSELDTDQYFTMVFGYLDLADGSLSLVQAGHPHPALQRAGGRVELLGRGGLPIGLIPGADYEPVSARLAPGDRLLLVSDGVTECAQEDGTMLEDEGLRALMGEHREARGPAFLDALRASLRSFSGQEDLSDDVSALMIEMDP